MSDDNPQDDQTPPTPAELVELRKAKSELDALKPTLVVEFKDGDKSEKVDLSTAEGRKRAAERGSGGLHLAQKAEKLNQEKAALDAKVKEQVEAELAKRGPTDKATGEPADVDVEKLIASHPELGKAIDDGDSEAFNKGLAAVLKDAFKAVRPAKSERPSGVTKEEFEAQSREIQEKTEHAVIFKTRVRPDPRFVALAERLAQVNRISKVEAEALIVANFNRVDPAEYTGMGADSAILEKVVAPWLSDLGIKVGAPSNEGRGSGKEDAPDGSHPSGGGAGGPGPRTFQSEIEVDKYLEEQKKAKRSGGGKWRPGE